MRTTSRQHHLHLHLALALVAATGIARAGEAPAHPGAPPAGAAPVGAPPAEHKAAPEAPPAGSAEAGHGEAAAGHGTEPAAHEGAAAGESHDAAAHHRHIGGVGVFGTFLMSPYNDHDEVTGAKTLKLKTLYGGGAFVKFYLDDKSYWAAELAVRALASSKDDSIYLPIDVIFMRIFKVKPFFKPFVGLGPTFVPVFKKDKLTGEGKTGFETGGALDLGAYWPIGESGFSILTVLHYNLLWDVTNLAAEVDADRLVHEVGLSAGASYTF